MNVQIRRHTVSELEELLEQGENYELLQGELIKVSPTKYDHGIMANEIGRILGNYAIEHDLGEVLGAETGVKFSNGDLIAPDATYVSNERLTDDAINENNWLVVAPDLVVEVASKSNTPDELQQKIDVYFQYGVKQVWVIYPAARKVMVYTAPNQVKILMSGETLSGGDVIPGFQISIDALFKRLSRSKKSK